MLARAPNCIRTLVEKRGVDLSSNDYLGMATHPKLRAAATEALQNGMELGAGGSRLLRGNHPAHTQLEEHAAAHFGFEKTLFFANGFMANYALLTTLPARQDVVLYDALCHASMRDGLRAGQADKIKIPHNDIGAFEDALKRVEGKYEKIFIAVESVYSMDGDLAPMPELYALAQKFGATLIIDEAHGTGIFGKNGKGLSENLPRENLISLHTCGKALGVAGGLVCAAKNIIDELINCARPFIYSTAPMPLQAHLVSTSLKILEEEAWRRKKLFALMKIAHGLFPTRSQSQIIPVILGCDEAALNAAHILQEKGYDIRAIRPPTVPEGTSRLRLSLNINIEETMLREVAEILRGLT